MAGRRNGPEVYRGRRKKLNVLGIVVGALAVLLLLIVVLFFGLQKYIVFGHDGISVVLPGSQAADSQEDGAAVGMEAELEQVSAAISITEPDYSDVSARAGEGLSDFIGIYVPVEDVSLSGVGRYVDVMSNYNANALVLEVKPVSGQLVWSSSSEIAAAYSTNGTVDLAALVAALRQQNSGIYLVAQISCCLDAMLASRSPTTALCLNTGAAYVDSEGAWLDPYNETVSQYIIELCEDLISIGFDELLLKSLCMPITDQAIGYQVELSSTPSPEAAICGLAMTITNALEGYDVPVSAILDTTSLRSGLAAQSGQNLELFGKVFDRLCSATDSAWRSNVDLSLIDEYLELGDTAQRYVPIMEYVPEGYSTSIVRVPESVLPAADTATDQGTGTQA